MAILSATAIAGQILRQIPGFRTNEESQLSATLRNAGAEGISLADEVANRHPNDPIWAFERWAGITPELVLALNADFILEKDRPRRVFGQLIDQFLFISMASPSHNWNPKLSQQEADRALMALGSDAQRHGVAGDELRPHVTRELEAVLAQKMPEAAKRMQGLMQQEPFGGAIEWATALTNQIRGESKVVEVDSNLVYAGFLFAGVVQEVDLTGEQQPQVFPYSFVKTASFRNN